MRVSRPVERSVATRSTHRPAALLLVAVLVAGCASTVQPSTSPAATIPPSPTATASPATIPTESPTSTPQPSAQASCADVTLAGLTRAQVVGQLFMVGLPKDRLADATRAGIATEHFGSVAFTTQSAAGVAAIRALTDSIQALATDATTGGVGFLVAVNQEGGQIQGLSGPAFSQIPSALDQGGLTPSVLERRATRWGRELLEAGINVDLAPVADVVPPGTDAQNAPIGQLQREYGHDPATVASHVVAFVRGMTTAGVASTAKHFPGLGRVAGNTDFTGDVVDDVTTRDDPYLLPFSRAVRAGVPFVMVSLATYERIDPDHLAVFSPTVIDGMLRENMGFHGVVISDALGATAVATIPPGRRAIDFLAAGGDMIIVNQVKPAIEMAVALRERATADPAFESRARDAARRVLEAKDAVGLLPCSG